eukprot:gene3934-7854_t
MDSMNFLDTYEAMLMPMHVAPNVESLPLISSEEVGIAQTTVEAGNVALQFSCGNDMQIGSDIVKKDVVFNGLPMSLLEHCHRLQEEFVDMKTFAKNSVEVLKTDINSSIAEISWKALSEIRILQQQLKVNEHERQRLHNQIQEQKGNIRVVCRVRPPASQCKSAVTCLKGCEGLSVTVHSKGIDKNGNPRPPEQKLFSFHSIHGPESNQEQVYNEIGGVTVSGVELMSVQTVADVERLWTLGLRKRSVGNTASNSESSRSHCLLVIDVLCRSNTISKQGDIATISAGRLSLVDLAGSERVSKSEVSAQALKETQHINQSLSALGDVVNALFERQRKEKKNSNRKGKDADIDRVHHIPCRNSKLTHLLMDSFRPGNKLVFVVQVAPEDCHIGETCSTLDFALRVQGVELGKIQSIKKQAQIECTERDVDELKGQLKTLQDQNEKLNSQLVSIREKESKLLSEREEMTAKKMTMDTELEALKVSVRKLTDELASKETRMQMLVKHNQKLSDQNVALKRVSQGSGSSQQGLTATSAVAVVMPSASTMKSTPMSSYKNTVSTMSCGTASSTLSGAVTGAGSSSQVLREWTHTDCLMSLSNNSNNNGSNNTSQYRKKAVDNESLVVTEESKRNNITGCKDSVKYDSSSSAVSVGKKRTRMVSFQLGEDQENDDNNNNANEENCSVFANTSRTCSENRDGNLDENCSMTTTTAHTVSGDESSTAFLVPSILRASSKFRTVRPSLTQSAVSALVVSTTTMPLKKRMLMTSQENLPNNVNTSYQMENEALDSSILESSFSFSSCSSLSKSIEFGTLPLSLTLSSKRKSLGASMRKQNKITSALGLPSRVENLPLRSASASKMELTVNKVEPTSIFSVIPRFANKLKVTATRPKLLAN